jgi:hypothetical protein
MTGMYLDVCRPQKRRRVGLIDESDEGLMKMKIFELVAAMDVPQSSSTTAYRPDYIQFQKSPS